MRWFEANRDRLLSSYEGEYVAIDDGAVVDHDEDFEALADRVFRRLGARAVYIPKVEREGRVVRLRSPRRSVP